MLKEYYLYLDLETKQMEIHNTNCEKKDLLIEQGKIIIRNKLGMASSKEEVYNKYKNVFPLQVINLPDCCE